MFFAIERGICNYMNNIIEKKTYQFIVGILFVLSILFAIIIFSLLGIQKDNNKTYIGTIAISNYQPNQYSSIISNNVIDWKTESEFYISYQNNTVQLDLSYFDLDVTQTIDMIQENQQNQLYFTISESNQDSLIADLELYFSPEIIAYLNMDDFVDDLLADAEEMNILKYYNIRDYFIADSENVVLSTFTINNISPVDATAISNAINSIDIEAKSRFSILDNFSDSTLNNTQLSIVASGIQKITSNTNFFGFVFEQYNNLPTWSSSGSNVRILKANYYDFSFYNDFEYPMLIEITNTTDSSITFALKGYPFMNTYSTSAIEEQVVPFTTVYVDNEDITSTTPGVITTETDEDYTYQLLTQSGVDGRIVSFYKTITHPNSTTSTERVYREQYLPITEIYQENIVLKGSE